MVIVAEVKGRRAVCGPGWWVVTGLGVYAYTAVGNFVDFLLLAGMDR